MSRAKWLRAVLGAAALALAGAGFAAGIALHARADLVAPQRVARIEPTPAPAAAKPTIVGEDPLSALLRSATVLAPRIHENLTVFPVAASHVSDFGSVLTLDEALTRGVLVIEEVGSGSVNQVVAVNRSDHYVFLMASEMIGGAKQDRTIGEDVLLEPRAKAHIPVFCVEAHRWAAAPDGKFYSVDAVTPVAVRRSARLEQDQAQVWAQVAREQERLSAPSPTGALRSVYESVEVQRSLEPYVAHLEKVAVAAPNVIGVVVAAGANIVAADLFYRPDLFRRLWPKLLRSYAAEVAGKRMHSIAFTTEDAERFLGRLYHAQRTPAQTPGAGRLLRLHGAGVNGSALIYQRSVVHLEVFPGLEILPLPEPAQAPMNLDFRRQRLEQDPQ